MEFCCNFSLPALPAGLGYETGYDKNAFDSFLEIDLLSIGHATK